MDAKFFYGLSGTFKGTTIDQKRLSADPVLWSEIKTWKSLETGIFAEQAGDRNDINYAMLHLCNLEQLLKNFTAFNICQCWNFFIERGVSDMAYYYFKNNNREETLWKYGEQWVLDSVKKETELLLSYGISNIHKTLLVQKDVKFLEETIFKETSRKNEFRGIDHYLKEQEDYIEFTKKFNDIDEVIEITNAKDYIVNTLKLEFKNTK